VVLTTNIKAQFVSSNQTYGAPRMHAELCEEGLSVGRHRVARLMRENCLKAHQKRRFKKTTDSHHDCPIALNVSDQNFACDGPDQKWGADISYIRTAEGWLYLGIVLDLYSRRIVGWATSDRLKKGLALKGPDPGHPDAATAGRPHPPFGPRQPILAQTTIAGSCKPMVSERR
jgi:putative transposase